MVYISNQGQKGVQMSRRRKSDSNGKTVFLMVLSGIFLAAAVYVVVRVAGAIHKDYSQIEWSSEHKTETAQSIEIEEEEKLGWNETENGWKYKLSDDSYAANQWLEVDGFLYHFNEDGIMAQGQWEADGQIYTCHDVKGYLKNIQTDLDYVPDDMGENLDSLVRTNAFWCYLDDEDTGIFKTILYRKAVENKTKPLGDENAPEKTTRYSMRADGDYVYYLPLVKESDRSKLTEAEKSLCGRLVRMIPGQNVKEIIAEDVDGYLILDGTVYYAQGGKIHSSQSGTEMAVGDVAGSVQIKDGNCYLVDSLGNTILPKNGAAVEIGDRSYRLEEDGQIRYVKRRTVSVNGNSYELKGNGSQMAVSIEADGNTKDKITGEYGVQSFCIVDNSIYFCAYVGRGTNGEWYSRIFRTDLNGGSKTAVSGIFAGTISNLYYFENEGEMYGEYYPEIWKNAYGVIVNVGKDGSVYRVSDKSARKGKNTSGNDMLELVTVQDGELICLWNDCNWSKETGVTKVLWSKAIEFPVSSKTSVETVSSLPKETVSSTKEESRAAVETVPVNPERTMGGKTSGSAQTTASPKQDTVLGTDAPGKSTQTQPAETKADEVKIVPLG